MKIRTALSAGVKMPPQAIRLLENASDGPLLSAVLKLESRKASLEIVVVDSALKAPNRKSRVTFPSHAEFQSRVIESGGGMAIGSEQGFKALTRPTARG